LILVAEVVAAAQRSLGLPASTADVAERPRTSASLLMLA
jgi:hypothetical protein